MASCPTCVVADASLARTLTYLNYFSDIIIDWNRYRVGLSVRAFFA